MSGCHPSQGKEWLPIKENRAQGYYVSHSENYPLKKKKKRLGWSLLHFVNDLEPWFPIYVKLASEEEVRRHNINMKMTVGW